jgi:hypothetical protein
LFCVGISERFGLQISFAPVEEDDFDFVATWLSGETQHFCPVQLKEVAPEDLNSMHSINDVLKSLRKYSNLRDVTIVIRLNRSMRFEPASLKMPSSLAIGGLWVLGSISDDQSKWAVWGDFMAAGAVTVGTVFSYPV